MKNIFKKIAVVALAVIMCVCTIPVASAAESRCPGANKPHTAYNCTYTVVKQTEASCEASGFVTGACNTCGVTFAANTVAALGHDWENTVTNCVTAGSRTCKRCAKVEVIGAATGHIWSEWTVTGGVCALGEIRSRVCTVCQTVDPTSGPMTEAHSFVVAAYDEPTTCVLPAKVTYKCENAGCDATKVAELWLRGEDATHSFVAWGETEDTKNTLDPNKVKATCLEGSGADTIVCEFCGYQKIVYSQREHVRTDMVFIDEELDVNACRGHGKVAYWQCKTCEVRYAYDPKDDTIPYVSYYAELGTTSPVYTSSSDTRYEIYRDYEYDDNKFDASKLTKLKDTDSIPNQDVYNGHDWKVYKKVHPTCTTSGYEVYECKRCGYNGSKQLEALGHIFYPDVESSARKGLLHDLGIYDQYSHSLTSTEWGYLGNLTRYNAANYYKKFTTPTSDPVNAIWQNKVGPTCTENAKVEWKCLNVDKNNSSAQCTEVKEAYLTGSRNKAVGHVWVEDEANSVETSCLDSGTLVYKCANAFAPATDEVLVTAEIDPATFVACEETKSEFVEAPGHVWVALEDDEVYDNPNYVDDISTPDEDAKIENKKVTCEEDGYVYYKCERHDEGCLRYKKEVIESTGEEHPWVAFDGTMPEPACGDDDVSEYLYCPICESDPVMMTIKAPTHQYHELTDEEKAELITKGSVVKVNDKVVVECLAEGDCTKSALYKFYCVNDGCDNFKSAKADPDKEGGSHKVVLLTNWYNADGVYDGGYKDEKGKIKGKLSGSANDGLSYINTLSCTAPTMAYKWYCSDKTCSLYRKENILTGKWENAAGEVKPLETFEFYGKHFDPETGKAITFRDVPDERISGAKDLAAARAVTAPVDENGNITAYAVEIPGTSLVWRYVADATCGNDQIKAGQGGLWCVDCADGGSFSAAGQAKAGVGTTRVNFHQTMGKGTLDDENVIKTVVEPTCATYGYTEYKCPHCDYTVQVGYAPMKKTHTVSDELLVDTKATCETAGMKVAQCLDCRQLITKIIPAKGHKNVSGIELLTSCLDQNATIDNRRCDNCGLIILSAHSYVDGKCKYCGIAE